jgi:hypothetical protein
MKRHYLIILAALAYQLNPRHALADYTRQTLAEIAKGPIPGARPVPMLQTLQTMAAK